MKFQPSFDELSLTARLAGSLLLPLAAGQPYFA